MPRLGAKLGPELLKNVKLRALSGLIMCRRQPVAALGSAALQDRTAILGRHASPKSVRLGSAAIVWLKCSLGHMSAILHSRQKSENNKRNQALSRRAAFVTHSGVKRQDLFAVSLGSNWKCWAPPISL